ncbi:MAG: inositol monophosphatase [Chloroflexi bacterium]|nr:inositol monophosphatase [Chloroflexota bacterium]
MNIDSFWEALFSEDTAIVRAAFQSLDAEERGTVFDTLRRIEADMERIEAQRDAARFAMNAIHSDAQALPEGALEFARALVHDVAQELKSSRGVRQATAKADGSLVTQFDLKADQRLCDALAAHFPGHTVLSEERRSIYGGEEWAWMIDPIDGTTNFTWGFPCWGVLVALLRFGQPMLGILDFPETAEQYWASLGGGAFRNGEALHCDSDAAEVLPTQLFSLCSRSVKAGLTQFGAKLRVSGSCGYDLALLAAGAIVGTQQMHVYPWDIAAGWVLAAEAGAVIHTFDATVFPLAPGSDCAARSVAVLGASSETLWAKFSAHTVSQNKKPEKS